MKSLAEFYKQQNPTPEDQEREKIAALTEAKCKEVLASSGVPGLREFVASLEEHNKVAAIVGEQEVLGQVHGKAFIETLKEAGYDIPALNEKLAALGDKLDLQNALLATLPGAVAGEA